MKANIKLAKMVLLVTRYREVNKTSLNKILFFIDMVHFLKCGKSISMETYKKLPYGPVPETIDNVRDTLVEGGYLKKSVYKNSVNVWYGFKASELFDFESIEKDFESEQLEIIYSISKKLSSLTASVLSQRSHEFEPWKSAKYWGDDLDFTKANNDDNLKNWIQKFIPIDNLVTA